MSVMRVAYGAPEPAGKSQKIMLGVGVGVALVAHGAILALVMQARGARLIWEPQPPAIQVDFAPRYVPPPPPPMAKTAATKAQAATSDPQPVPVTREATTPTATSDLVAHPQGTTAPTAGTEAKGEPQPNPPQPPVKADPVIRNADWARRPTGADMARFYPDRAQRLNVEGATLISCIVSIEGAAEACRVIRETPANYGFGDAALKLAKSFRFKPMTVDGQAKAGGAIQIPLAWRLQ